jgi:hypothetical protein
VKGIFEPLKVGINRMNLLNSNRVIVIDEYREVLFPHPLMIFPHQSLMGVEISLA